MYALVSALVSVNIGFDDTNVQFESDVDVLTVYVPPCKALSEYAAINLSIAGCKNVSLHQFDPLLEYFHLMLNTKA